MTDKELKELIEFDEDEERIKWFAAFYHGLTPREEEILKYAIDVVNGWYWLCGNDSTLTSDYWWRLMVDRYYESRFRLLNETIDRKLGKKNV